jgi:hypothetical protein
MFGMTKKQFLKKSRNCLKDTGIELLLIREIFSQEMKGNIAPEETFQKLEKIRKNLEDIFFKYEGLNPPSKCNPLHRNISHTIIILQEAVVINSEYLILLKDSLKDQRDEKLKKSIDKLEEFRDEFGKLVQEVDLYLGPR